MYVKVETSGCCERKGKVRVRLCFYLDKTDVGYDKCHIRVPVGRPVYEGAMGEYFEDTEDYQDWYDALDKEWIDVPFHNHFIYVEATTTNKAILDTGEKFIKEAYASWSKEEPITCKNPHIKFDEVVMAQKKSACISRANAMTAIERKLL